MQEKTQITAAEQSAWLAGLDEGRAQKTTPAEAAVGTPVTLWIERWHGSGGKEGLEGWSILDAGSRSLVAYLGREVDSKAVTAIVMVHNAQLARASVPAAQAAMQCAECNPCGAAYDVDSYQAGFTNGKGHCSECPGIDHAPPPDQKCTCPSGDGSLRWPCPVHPPAQERKPQYRLLERGVDSIKPDDEFLKDDGVTWVTDPKGVFVGMKYLGDALLPARRPLGTGVTNAD